MVAVCPTPSFGSGSGLPLNSQLALNFALLCNPNIYVGHIGRGMLVVCCNLLRHTFRPVKRGCDVAVSFPPLSFSCEMSGFRPWTSDLGSSGLRLPASPLRLRFCSIQPHPTSAT